MAITIHCPFCQGQFNVRDDFAGRKGRCPECGEIVQAPTAAAVQAAPPRRAEPRVAPQRAAAPPVDMPTPSSLTQSGSFPIDVEDSSVAMRAGSGRRARGTRRKAPVWPFVALGVAVPLVLILVAAVVISQRPGGEETVQIEDSPAATSETGGGERTPPPDPTTVADTQFDEPVEVNSVDELTAAMIKILTPVSENSAILGAGFIIDRRGWVATNYHVIEQGNQFTTAFTENGTEYAVAGVIAANPNRDLAIIKLAEMPYQITVADISYGGEPNRLDKCYAYGHPEGNEFSVSDGVVSRVVQTADLPQGDVLNFLRYQMGAPEDQIWIQHTAQISHGNSGGPLLNEDFRIIGINTWVHDVAKMGFASHIRYMRDMKSVSTDDVEPFPELQVRGPGRSKLGMQPQSWRDFVPYRQENTWTRFDAPWWQNPFVVDHLLHGAA